MLFGVNSGNSTMRILLLSMSLQAYLELSAE